MSESSNKSGWWPSTRPSSFFPSCFRPAPAPVRLGRRLDRQAGAESAPDHLPMERFLSRFRWAAPSGKPIIRYGLYNLTGNVVFVLVMLTFLDFHPAHLEHAGALQPAQRCHSIPPRLVKAALIALFGWYLAKGSGHAIATRTFRDNASQPPLRHGSSGWPCFFSSSAAWPSLRSIWRGRS